jgi:O-glycosyl hydrolase
MRRALLIAVAILAVVAPACSSSKTASKVVPTTTTSLVPVPAGTPAATVDSQPSQTIAAFGASGAWWPIDLVHFPKQAQQFVADQLFTSRGIALSGYRYNIGGGGVGVTTPSRAPHEVTTDVAGLTFLRAASAAHVPALTGFVNSAPTQYTTNGKSCGGQLRVGAEPTFAQYLAGVVRSLHAEGMTLDFVSPMNEPDNSMPDCGQEGMAVPVAQRAPLVNALGQALANRAPYARVIADETTADVILASEAPQWVSSAKQYLFAIAHHTYDFPNDGIRELLPPLAKQFGKATWMTEICCYKGSGGVATSMGANYDPTITQGLWLADQIYDDFTIAGDSAWFWWTALSSVIGCDPHADPSCATRVNPKGFNDGLLYYDPNYATNGDTAIFTTKRFYALGQFSRYVRPGAVLHHVNGLPAGVRALAFAQGSHWTVVTWNDGNVASQFTFGVPATSLARDAVTTSASADLAPTARPARTTAGNWLVSLAPRAIVTYTFDAGS